MTRILAIETTSQACSVALIDRGSLTEEFAVMPKLHARQILPMVDRIITQSGYELADLDAIAFANGPGSFTGIRIATGVAQGLAFGVDLPLVPVSSLAVLAQTCSREREQSNTMVAIDARMDQVYWACYRQVEGLAELQGEEQLASPEFIEAGMVDDTQGSWFGVGDGWKYAERFPREIFKKIGQVDMECYPHARDVAILAVNKLASGSTFHPEQAQPNYLRGREAWKKSVKK